jgi:catabolite regulation protein CreA
MRFGCIAVLLLTVGCVTASQVQPIGNGRYMITARASGGLNAGKETTEAQADANSYCAKLGKHMMQQDLDKTGNAAVFGENVSITFTCE